MTELTQCPDVLIHSGTLSSFVVRFLALRAKKRTTVEEYHAAAGKAAFESATA
jgi:hypothetical protein